jgi:SAM-dependent methyltransferase
MVRAEGEGNMTEDPFASFKEQQRKSWAHFAPIEALTTPPAGALVRFAGLRAGSRVLDVGCGTGVVAVTAARIGCAVTGLDLSPDLLARARENSALAGVEVAWHEGDAEALPFEDASFDAVVSQYGHIFAPRPDVVTRQMLRVLRPGGTVAFSTWPPEGFIGRMFTIVGRRMPPPPPGFTPPTAWGEPTFVAARLGDAVRDLSFDRATMLSPVLSPAHYRAFLELTSGPVIGFVSRARKEDSASLADFRREIESLAAEYTRDNVLRQDFLMSRATKV